MLALSVRVREQVVDDEATIGRREKILLKLQHDELALTRCTGAGPVPLVSASLAGIRNVLETGRLNGARLESVINQIEDMIMPALQGLPGSDELEVTGADFARAFGLLPKDEAVVARIDSIERLFNQLADHAGGSPLAWQHALPPGDLALGLTVLREIMHHGRFGSAELVTKKET